MIKFSIVIPSRGRAKECFGAVDTLLAIAKNPQEVEVIIRIDEDDPQKELYVSNWPRVIVLVGPRYGGYAENHKLIEEAVKQTKGEYIMQYVDMAEMLTPEWDRIYEECFRNHRLLVVGSRVVDGEGRMGYEWSFPLIPRELYETTGEFCLGQNPSVDRCWKAFGDELDVLELAPVSIIHHEKRGTGRLDITAAETLPFYDELNANWTVRSAEHRAVGKKYADIVRAKL